MKESSGELSMTVVVIVAAVALIGMVSWLLGDTSPVRTWITNWFNNSTTTGIQ